VCVHAEPSHLSRIVELSHLPLTPKPPHPQPTPTPTPSYRPHPIKVVFGKPLVPKPNETADELHGRYCAALLSLAKQHDVPLRIVE